MKRSRKCDLDGGPLDARGYCAIGGGYVAGAPCPFACPICRKGLTWDGYCYSCHGASDMELWTIPGDRYELQDGHWCLAEKGLRPTCTREQNQEALKIVGAVYARRTTAADGHARLTVLLGERRLVPR